MNAHVTPTTVRMNPEIRAEWLRRLRSGDYRQGHRQLRQLDVEGYPTYCCLGVLCELAVERGVVTRRDQDPEGYDVDTYVAPPRDDLLTDVPEASDTYPPPTVVRWAGLPDPDPVVAGRSLSGWNDDERTNFARIADLIEEYL